MSHIKLKICGVQSVDEAQQLTSLGIDYIGLNFVPTSSRLITIDTAEAIVAAIKSSSTQTVALFRDQPLELVNDYANRLDIDYVQLHGDEPADYAKQIKAPVIKAITANPSRIEDLLQYIADYPADYFVLDRPQQGQGPIVNTDTAKQIINATPGKIFLAGGLGPDNLSDILKVVQPYGIDIASGVRTDKVLDLAKVGDCLTIIKNS